MVTTIASMDARPDQSVLHRASTGEQSAWNELVDAYDRLVWHVVLGFGLRPEDAADVHQTTWLRLAEHLGDIREAARLGSWLATTARRECQRLGSSRLKELPVEFEVDTVADERHLDERLLNDERASALWHAFAGLDAKCQQLLRLLIAEPTFSYEEIGVLLDMPIGSIGPSRARCLAKLAQSPRVQALEESP